MNGHLDDAFPEGRRLRIAQIAPPLERVPPGGYGGTERVVDELVRELVRRGHEVTVFASGDSDVPGELVPTVPLALRPAGYTGDHLGYFVSTVVEVLKREHEFDVLHSHLEWMSIPLMAAATTPALATFHGRIDWPYAARVLEAAPPGLVAISRSQAATHPNVAWAAIIYNGLSLERAPFERRGGDGLCFVGRVAPEKGILEAIEVARLSGRRLRIAAKIGPGRDEQAYADEVFRPALERADTEFLGEIEGPARDQLMAESYATLMTGAWPEPFGLVAIESLACGTPVMACRVGALPEIVREGVDGFFGDDPQHLAFLLDRVADLDREAIRASVIERFSARRMADGYEAAYRRLLADREAGPNTAGAPVMEGLEPELRIGPHRPVTRLAPRSATTRPHVPAIEIQRS